MIPEGSGAKVLPEPPRAGSGRWGDLGVRVVSGLVLAGVGALAVRLGGPVLLTVAVLTFGLMAWELAGLTDTPANPALRVGVGVLAGFGVWSLVGIARSFSPSAGQIIVLFLAFALLIEGVADYRNFTEVIVNSGMEDLAVKGIRDVMGR